MKFVRWNSNFGMLLDLTERAFSKLKYAQCLVLARV